VSIRTERTGGASTRNGHRSWTAAAGATGTARIAKATDSTSTAEETPKRMPTDDQLDSPYVIVVELMCIGCFHREITQIPYGIMLRNMECSECGESGYLITTGQPIYGDQEIGIDMMPGDE
jgi:hypothetical protein